jgi:lipopolysaccharide transport system permease protein
LLLQLAMFMPGVLYPVSKLPVAWRGLYTAIIPVGAIIDQLRNCFFYNQAPSASVMAIAGISSLIWLTMGFLFFKRLETGFADVS